ncbi:SPOR domain-containing protein [Ralstonia insidiosa]|jgi:DedD protein|uniref:SPOR domain-containing protein n=1 Tax=Ralstonia TaxID=48736 RepID=UPI00066486C2|nr:SPOR domain-containing protein [Ralstonia insidiosa]KMW48148.1 sporulation protein [Ralstonia sp. MD27]MBX3770249.1 SPOR domain-containing protein [Ralstonia pickettii]NOZ15794.1 SPOR domain-containing protein [Betaproteobacteria bacterium]MBA9854411.1 SPOR domain-containing protein [Ralstonia insidiosa]MBA9868226.1 SPOR domain-containing protein [Ralstonia insidiosa]
MGLFSIFSSRKNAEGERSRGAAGSAADVARDAVHESRTSSRASSNSRSRASRRTDDDDDGLDPELPQKQRARRRLIGAVVLVGAAVVVLPLVFDAKPRPVTDAVAVQIQDQPIDRGAKASTDEPKVASRRSAPRAPGSSADQPQALDQGEEVVASAEASSPSTPAPAQNTPSAKPTPPKTVASLTPPADAKPAAKPAQPAPQAATPSADASGNKFVLLIGAFASEDRARNWLGKLKAEKIPGYIEHKKVPEKGDLALLRAGPFNDRAAAEAAQKRAEQIGLTPKLVQQ